MSEARAARYLGRHALRQVTTVLRCYDCGREPRGSAVAVRRTSEGVAGFAGLVSCGRIWLCPVCNAKVMARRAVEIGAALTWATVNGYQVIWGSLTIRHNAQSDLAAMLDQQRSAWRYVVSSKSWRSVSSTQTVEHAHDVSCAATCERKRDVVDTGKPGRVGYIRAAEITIGSNGWHPHFHPIIIVRGTPQEAQAIADETVRTWLDGVHYAGGEAYGYGAQQLRVLDARGSYDALAGYVTKASYDPVKHALEAVWSQGKVGRGRAHSTTAHWGLLVAIATGEVLGEELNPIGRWHELEEATHLHRMVMWSRGLRSFASLGVEVDDETIAAEEVGTSEDSLVFITTDGWVSIRDRPELLALILEVTSGAGASGLRALLDAHRVEYFTLVPSSL